MCSSSSSIQRSEVKGRQCSRNDRRECCWRVQGGVFVVVVVEDDAVAGVWGFWATTA